MLYCNIQTVIQPNDLVDFHSEAELIVILA